MGCGCGKGKPANIRSQTVVPKAPASRSVTPQKIERSLQRVHVLFRQVWLLYECLGRGSIQYAFSCADIPKRIGLSRYVSEFHLQHIVISRFGELDTCAFQTDSGR